MLGLDGLVALLRLTEGLDAPLPQIELAPPANPASGGQTHDNAKKTH
jgi:hypothetical protein